jgi:hypothetical protein
MNPSPWPCLADPLQEAGKVMVESGHGAKDVAGQACRQTVQGQEQGLQEEQGLQV